MAAFSLNTDEDPFGSRDRLLAQAARERLVAAVKAAARGADGPTRQVWPRRWSAALACLTAGLALPAAVAPGQAGKLDGRNE